MSDSMISPFKPLQYAKSNISDFQTSSGTASVNNKITDLHLSLSTETHPSASTSLKSRSITKKNKTLEKQDDEQNVSNKIPRTSNDSLSIEWDTLQRCSEEEFQKKLLSLMPLDENEEEFVIASKQVLKDYVGINRQKIQMGRFQLILSIFRNLSTATLIENLLPENVLKDRELAETLVECLKYFRCSVGNELENVSSDGRRIFYVTAFLSVYDSEDKPPITYQAVREVLIDYLDACSIEILLKLEASCNARAIEQKIPVDIHDVKFSSLWTHLIRRRTTQELIEILVEIPTIENHPKAYQAVTSLLNNRFQELTLEELKDELKESSEIIDGGRSLLANPTLFKMIWPRLNKLEDHDLAEFLFYMLSGVLYCDDDPYFVYHCYTASQKVLIDYLIDYKEKTAVVQKICSIFGTFTLENLLYEFIRKKLIENKGELVISSSSQNCQECISKILELTSGMDPHFLRGDRDLGSLFEDLIRRLADNLGKELTFYEKNWRPTLADPKIFEIVWPCIKQFNKKTLRAFLLKLLINSSKCSQPIDYKTCPESKFLINFACKYKEDSALVHQLFCIFEDEILEKLLDEFVANDN
jgi:hypothetical protein